MSRRTIKLTLEYDGTDFVGWQYQRNGRSVQEVVERGLSRILQESVRVVGAGRTDAGVHAKGQVASFESESSVHCERIVRGLNGVFPDDVVALCAEEMPAGFNARYDAELRRYRYCISCRPTAISRRVSWVVGYQLDFDLMNDCLDSLRGEHDFESFCRSEAEVKHYRCHVHEAILTRTDDAMLVFEISANRFLHGMVRTIVGTLVEIGRGHRPAGDLEVIMASKDRRRAGMAAPPQGLFLVEVKYKSRA